MRFVIIDAGGENWQLGSTLFHFFALFAINVSPALLQSLRNPIHAATPFPLRKAETAPDEQS
jgi:hypothetical protein